MVATASDDPEVSVQLEDLPVQRQFAYSLKLLLGVIAAVGYAAGAFLAPPSVVSGILAMVLGTRYE